MKFSRWLLIGLLFGMSFSTVFAQRANPRPSPTPANPRWESAIACYPSRKGYELTSDTYNSFTRDRALRMRETLDTDWHSQLPCCPETIPDPENQLYEERSDFMSCFHPGAERSFRTSKLYQSLVKPSRS